MVCQSTTVNSIISIYKIQQSMTKKIAICIPTYKEADTIQKTISIVDLGLKKYFGDFRVYIVNADNDSRDGTKRNFLSTKTYSRKEYLSTHKIGKGYNLIKFFDYCIKNKIDYAATIDCDIKTLKLIWIKLLLDPLIKGNSDYITPVYVRNRFEGSTTNNFAYPFIYSFFGKDVRQPIGGDFAFNSRYLKYISKQPIIESTKKYGIDIFMTIHAIGGNFRTKQVFLGQKIHKPSFTKIRFMPQQVFESAFHALQYYRPLVDHIRFKKIECVKNTNQSEDFNHRTEALKLLNKSLKKITAFRKNYFEILPQWKKLERKIINDKAIDYKNWAIILSSFIFLAKTGNKPKYLSELLAPISLVRTITLWTDSENLNYSEIESQVVQQAKEARKNLLLSKELYSRL